MRFKIIRLSSNRYYNSPPPCKEAFLVSSVDDDPFREVWEEPKLINEYAVDVNSLDELMALIKKYGKMVVHEDELEIYDDWRE